MAAKIKGRTVSKGKISQRIDLEEVFGLDFTGKKALKEKIGQAIIDYMLDRTAASKDISSNAFTAYSKGYKDSKEFEKYGKSGRVNMELKGDMLDDIDISRIEANAVTIAITDTLEKKKAYNHIEGDTLPRRDFFGVRKKDLDVIKKEFSADLKALPVKKAARDETRESLDALEQLGASASGLGSLVDNLFSTPGGN